MSIVDLHGSKLGVTHADTEVKLGDPDTKARENFGILSKINSSNLYGTQFDAWAFGHYHKGRYQMGHPRILWNGPLVPPNGHAPDGLHRRAVRAVDLGGRRGAPDR